jgi:4'-phosphopantetheinyl transferase
MTISSGATRAIALTAPVPAFEIWYCDLVRSAGDVAAMERTLSGTERARASRFGRPDLRDRYVVGRATLRAILGAALDLDPARVALVRGHRGRPEVEGGALDFNVSHTRGTALFAVTRTGRAGVDVEHRDRTLNVDGIARKFMSSREQAMLAQLDREARRRALLRLWTCKEAMSKATGDALSAPFARMDVAIDPSLALLEGPPPYDAGRFGLHAVRMPGDYFATVALWAPPAADARLRLAQDVQGSAS